MRTEKIRKEPSLDPNKEYTQGTGLVQYKEYVCKESLIPNIVFCIIMIFLLTKMSSIEFLHIAPRNCDVLLLCYPIITIVWILDFQISHQRVAWLIHNGSRC